MSNSLSIRLFIAIELPSQLKDSVFETFSQYHNHSSLIKWISAENLHVTLRFLGNTPSHQIPMLESLLTKTSNGFSAFDFSLGSCGVFPSNKKPSVLWVGITQGALESAAIASELNQQLSNNGFQQDTHPFKPHITVARTKKKTHHKQIAGLYDTIIKSTANQHIGSCTIDNISLIQSTLTPQGPRYTTLICSALR